MTAIKWIAYVITNLLSVTMYAQNTITIIVTGMPASPGADMIYIAGNFNHWNTQDENFRLQKNADGFLSVTLKDLAPGTYECKFTRGSWDKAETDAEGGDISNRKITIGAVTSIQVVIAGWKDTFVRSHSTASAQVTVIDTAFGMPQLGRTRRIWIYLPRGYAAGAKKYPVLYMHDGQNLFDNATSYAGEWGIDETLDTLEHACIIVGIDNGGLKRMTEYNPNDTKQFGKGEGKAYLSFIVNTLKPFIDKKYRTLPDKMHTCMAGSSMGGLISFYAGLYYPQVFGVLGVFSPSFWIVPGMRMQITQLATKTQQGTQRYYCYAGGAEDKRMAADMETVMAVLKTTANPELVAIVDPDGKHNEASWGNAFPEFYRWAMKGMGD